MPDNLGRSVTWQDEDGGHHTGREVRQPGDYRVMAWSLTLIRESCDGVLTWVESAKLKPWLSREERGEE